jgi:hypothetical protein
MPKKAKSGLAPMLKTGGTQVAAFTGTAAVSEGVGQALSVAAAKKDRDPNSPEEQAKASAIKAGASIGTGITGAMVAGALKQRKLVPAILGGAMLKAAIDTLPLARYVANKFVAMFKKKPAGAEGIARVRRERGSDVQAGEEVRDLVN